MSKAHSRGVTTVREAVALSVLALGCASPLMAQTTESDELENVVVTGHATTATKTDTPILNIPQSIEIVTSQKIDDIGARTIVEALNYTAGVSNGGDDSRGDFNNIRGFESVLYVDGLKRNYGFVYLPRADVNALERIEVLVGPASVLYGSGSAGGLTNMQSKRPQFQSAGSASVSYGTFDRKEAIVDVTGPMGGDTVAGRFVALYRNSDSQIDFIPNDRVLLQPAITWRPGENTEVTAIALYQRDKNGPNYNVVPLAASIFAPPGRRLSDTVYLGEPGFNDKGHKDNKSLTLLVNHDFSDMFNFHSATRASKASTDQREIYVNAFINPFNPFIDENGNGTIEDDETMVPRNFFAFDVKYKTFNSDNNVGINFGAENFRNKVLVGVDYSYFRQFGRQAFGLSTPIDLYNPVYGTAPPLDYSDPTTQVLKQTGYYLQDQIDFGKWASLVLGARRDHYTKRDTGVPNETTNKTTKRAGLTVNVTEQIAPFVSYSESFLPIAGLNQFGSTYSPLSGKQKEVGVKWQPLRTTLLRVSYYQIKEDNALRPEPGNPLNSIQSGSTKSKGFEFQADHNVAKNLTITASYSHSTTKQTIDDEGNYGPQRDNFPKELANLFATKTVAFGDDMTFRFGGGVRYTGRQTAGVRNDPFVAYVVTPSYTLVDAMASFDYSKWQFQLNALNLLDKQYYPACFAYGFCANGLKRTVQATVAYKF
jgi:iron complex outermembrane receptor protein